MSDGMSDGKNYGPFLSKHAAPIISKDGKPVEKPMRDLGNCLDCGSKISDSSEHGSYCNRCLEKREPTA